MAKTIHCRTCGAIAWGRTESYGDDRCDDCINRSERLAEIESDNAPPEYKEGRKAYVQGKSKYENPYTIRNPKPNTLEVHENTSEMLWNQGWQVEWAKDYT